MGEFAHIDIVIILEESLWLKKNVDRLVADTRRNRGKLGALLIELPL